MPARLLERVVRRIFKPVIETGSVTFFVRDLQEEQSPLLATSATTATVKELQAGDKDALLHGADPGRSWQAVRARFDGGDRCFAAVDASGRALHTRWLTIEGAFIPEIESAFTPAPDAAYAYDAYTRPDSRRKGLDGAARHALFDAARRLGRRRVYSYARGDNPDGLRAAARLQRKVATLVWLRLFGRLVFVSEASGTALETQLARKKR
jgi:GNAT superfamily N-acetyltransferase